MDHNQLLSGKNVFITGAGANIGHAIALEMAAEGASVYFADKDAARCDAVEKELRALGVESKSFAADIAKPQGIETLYQALVENEIAIDVLVNNVGIYGEKSPDGGETWQEWQRVYNTNVIGPFHLTGLMTPAMSERGGGSVIFITSMHQWEVYGVPSYSSSKAALGMIVKELAVELAPRNIRVNGIAPGHIEQDENGEPVANRFVPLRKTSIPPLYVGRAAVYLASEYFSKYTTGSILALDNGLYLGNHLTLDDSPSPSFASRVARRIRRASRL